MEGLLAGHSIVGMPRRDGINTLEFAAFSGDTLAVCRWELSSNPDQQTLQIDYLF